MDIEVLTWAELVARTGSRGAALRSLREGSWRRVMRNAYVDAVHVDGPEVRAAAVATALPAGVAVSGRAALWLAGLNVLPADGTLDVSVERGRHLQVRPGFAAHIAALPESELCETNGLLLVSAARAFVDVARREPLIEAVAVGDAVLRSGAATVEDITAAVARARGLRGVLMARAAVPMLEPRSESPMESRLRLKVVRSGLPRPEAQVDFYDETGGHIARGDLVLDGVVLEYDGRVVHDELDRFQSDRRRRRAIADVGLELREFTSADVYQRSDADLRADIERAMCMAAGRGPSRARRGPDTLRAPRLRPLPTLSDVRRTQAA